MPWLSSTSLPSSQSLFLSSLPQSWTGAGLGAAGSRPAAAWVRSPACSQGHRWVGSLVHGQGAWGGGGHWLLEKKLIQDSLMPSISLSAPRVQVWRDFSLCAQCPAWNVCLTLFLRAPMQLGEPPLVIVTAWMCVCVAGEKHGKLWEPLLNSQYLS